VSSRFRVGVVATGGRGNDGGMQVRMQIFLVFLLYLAGEDNGELTQKAGGKKDYKIINPVC